MHNMAWKAAWPYAVLVTGNSQLRAEMTGFASTTKWSPKCHYFQNMKIRQLLKILPIHYL